MLFLFFSSISKEFLELIQKATVINIHLKILPNLDIYSNAIVTGVTLSLVITKKLKKVPAQYNSKAATNQKS